MNKTGTSHTSATQEFSRSLNRISESTFGREEEDDVGVAFQKFAIVTRQLSELMKDLVSGYCYSFLYYLLFIKQHFMPFFVMFHDNE